MELIYGTDRLDWAVLLQLVTYIYLLMHYLKTYTLIENAHQTLLRLMQSKEDSKACKLQPTSKPI